MAFTLTRYGGLLQDGSGEAVARLDALLGTGVGRPLEIWGLLRPLSPPAGLAFRIGDTAPAGRSVADQKGCS